MKYRLLRNLPVAKFFYQGQSHSHPVRRTVLLTEATPTHIRGYELREGADTRIFRQAPIKSYRRDKIARINQLDRRRTLRKKAPKKQQKKSTLQRVNLVDLVVNGV